MKRVIELLKIFDYRAGSGFFYVNCIKFKRMKKKIILLAVLMSVIIQSGFVYGQELSKGKRAQTDTSIEKEVYTIVEVQPQFPGGESARQEYIAKNIHYPDLARNNNIQGTVYVSFVVERNGSVSDIKIVKGIGSGCDKEVIRVVKKMPKWKPGIQRGKNVRVKINMPVKFMFEE